MTFSFILVLKKTQESLRRRCEEVKITDSLDCKNDRRMKLCSPP